MLLSPGTSYHVQQNHEPDSSKVSYVEQVSEDSSSSISIVLSPVNVGTNTDKRVENVEVINTEAQTDIVGIESLFAYSEHLPHDDDAAMLLPYIVDEQGLVDEAFGQETDPDLVCCKCQQDGSEEKLSKCYSAGAAKLIDLCRLLGLHEILATIEQQLNAGKLRVHESCRQTLHNEGRDASKKSKSRSCFQIK